MSRRAWIAFAAMSIIWGASYLFIKIGVDGGVPPLVLAWGRVTLAAVVLLALAWRAGTLPSVRGGWRWLVAYAVAEISIPFPLIAAGEVHVASSLAAIIVAAVPLVGAVLAIRFDESERPTPVRALGLVVGFGGVVVLLGIDVSGNAKELIGAGLILLATVGYAIGPMVVKHRLGGLDPRATMGVSLAISSLILLAPAIADRPHSAPTIGAVGAVVFLGLVCTAAAFVIFTVLIGEAGTSRATVITYVNPVVALALGVAVLGERPGTGALAGLLLILAGSWLSTDGRLPPAVRPLFARAGVRARRREVRPDTSTGTGTSTGHENVPRGGHLRSLGDVSRAQRGQHPAACRTGVDRDVIRGRSRWVGRDGAVAPSHAGAPPAPASDVQNGPPDRSAEPLWGEMGAQRLIWPRPTSGSVERVSFAAPRRPGAPRRHAARHGPRTRGPTGPAVPN